MISFVLSVLVSWSASAEVTQRQWSAAVGPGVVSGLRTGTVMTEWRGAYGVTFDRAWEVQAFIDVVRSGTQTDTRFTTGGGALNYFFSNETETPFVTADLAYGDAHAHWACLDARCQSPRDDASGLAFGVGGGYKFLRAHMLNLGVQLHYDVLFANTRSGTPQKWGLQGVVYF